MLQQVPRTRVGPWGLEDLVKNTKTWVKIIKQTRIVPGGVPVNTAIYLCLCFIYFYTQTQQGKIKKKTALTWYKESLEQLLASVHWAIKPLMYDKSILLLRQWIYPRSNILKATTPYVKPLNSKEGAELYLNFLIIGQEEVDLLVWAILMTKSPRNHTLGQGV